MVYTDTELVATCAAHDVSFDQSRRGLDGVEEGAHFEGGVVDLRPVRVERGGGKAGHRRGAGGSQLMGNR